MSASTANTVHVKNISEKTTEEDVRNFFSFCGKIKELTLTNEGSSKAATVTFEKETAAKTALLLDSTNFGESNIKVSSASGTNPDDKDTHTSEERGDSEEISQEEKPRSRIFAEYLAHGYVIGDAAVQRAIELDKTHGVSERFAKTLQNLDSKYHASDKVKSADESYGITQRASNLWGGLSSYFEKAANTPTGQRLVQFYLQGQNQVQDVHTEARRLADLKKQQHGGSAYKAAGLEKVFGAEKSTTGSGDHSTTDETRKPTEPAHGGEGVASSTSIPK